MEALVVVCGVFIFVAVYLVCSSSLVCPFRAV